MTLKEQRLKDIARRLKAEAEQASVDLEEWMDLTEEDIKELKNENHRA